MPQPVVRLPRKVRHTPMSRKNSGVQRLDVASSAIALTPFSQYSVEQNDPGQDRARRSREQSRFHQTDSGEKGP